MTEQHFTLLETNKPFFMSQDTEYIISTNPGVVVYERKLCIAHTDFDVLDEEELSWCCSKLVSIYDLHCSRVLDYG